MLVGPGRRPLGGLPASYEGDLPCADCEAIRYHLDLFETPRSSCG